MRKNPENMDNIKNLHRLAGKGGQILLLLGCIVGGVIIYFNAIKFKPDLELPVSHEGIQLYYPEPIGVLVSKTGDAKLTATGQKIPWSMGNSVWIFDTPYAERVEKDCNRRERLGSYGSTVPVLLYLDKRLEFLPPRGDDLFVNLWLVVSDKKSNEQTKALSVCIPDICTFPGARNYLWFYWHGKHVRISLKQGSLPIIQLPGNRFKFIKDAPYVSHEIGGNIPISGCGPLGPPVVSSWPKEDVVSLEQLKEIILKKYKRGIILCMKVAEGVKVQEIVSFMDMCEQLQQPWTWQFSTSFADFADYANSGTQ